VCELFIFDPIFNTLLSILIKLPGSLDLQPEETPGVITSLDLVHFIHFTWLREGSLVNSP
jgi:hypothetical protein